MQGGVKHLVMLNHSRGKRMLGALQSDSTRAEGGGRRPGRNTRSPSGTGGGARGDWRQGEGVQVGVKLVLVSMENNNNY